MCFRVYFSLFTSYMCCVVITGHGSNWFNVCLPFTSFSSSYCDNDKTHATPSGRNLSILNLFLQYPQPVWKKIPQNKCFSNYLWWNKRVLMTLYHSIFSMYALIPVYFNSCLTDGTASWLSLIFVFIHSEVL